MWARLGAVLVATSAVLHLPLVPDLSSGWALFMLALSAVCVPCAVKLWRGDSWAAWSMVAVMSGLMLASHLFLSLGGQADRGGVHGDHHSGMRDDQGVAGLMVIALVLAAVELGLAVHALLVRRARAKSLVRD